MLHKISARIELNIIFTCRNARYFIYSSLSNAVVKLMIITDIKSCDKSFLFLSRARARVSLRELVTLFIKRMSNV